jgi:hypothetical protein
MVYLSDLTLCESRFFSHNLAVSIEFDKSMKHSPAVFIHAGAVDYKSTGLRLEIPEVTECNEKRWWAWKGSNLRPMDYETRPASLETH